MVSKLDAKTGKRIKEWVGKTIEYSRQLYELRGSQCRGREISEG